MHFKIHSFQMKTSFDFLAMVASVQILLLKSDLNVHILVECP